MKSFEEYVKNATARAKADYKDALESAAASKRLNDASDTAFKQKLSSLGLSRSGYADYLKGERTDIENARQIKAKRELYEAEANAYSGYAEYVNNYETLQTALNEKFIDGLITDGIFDVEEAERLAIESGIPKQRAKEVAELGVTVSRKRVASAAVKYAKEKNYSYDGTVYYALSLGLSDSDAKWVADQIFRVNEADADRYASLDKDGYFEEIKNSKD